MKIFFYFILVSCLLVNNTKLYGQTTISDKTVVIPPSPEAALLTKYGQYPISNFTGLPEISIPLHLLSIKDIELPVSINYHSGGNKVSDFASWIGLGWTLQAGGVITRSVLGVPDESQEGIFNNPIKSTASITQNDHSYLLDIVQDNKDSQPDEFYFNFMGRSGKFVFSADREILTIPHNNLRVKFENDTFKIIDESGRTYLFEERVFNTKFSEYRTSKYLPTTAWYLTKIISKNGIDTVSLKYLQYNFGNIQSTDYSLTVGRYIGVINNSIGPIRHSGVPVKTFFYENPGFCYLSEITFGEQKILFIPRSDRLDYGGYSLDEIVVKDGNKILKHINFSHDYFYSDVGYNPYTIPKDKYRLKLTGINFVNNNSDIIESGYKFEYEENYKLPPRNNCGIDWWGYSNGKYQNKHLIPLDDNGLQYKFTDELGYETSSIISDPADRNSDTSYMKAAVLKRIRYPTGGYSDFDFEANRILLAFTRTQDVEKIVATAIASKQDPGPVSIDFTSQVNTEEANLSINLKLWHDIKQPYVEFRNLTKGTYERFVAYPGEQTSLRIATKLVLGDKYRITTHIRSNFMDSEDDIDERVIASVGYSELSEESYNKIQFGPGLRIRSIKSYLSDGSLSFKEIYKYGEEENGLGKPRFFDYIFQRRNYTQKYEYNFFTGGQQIFTTYLSALEVLSRPLFDYSSGNYLIAYPNVTKYTAGLDSFPMKTTYVYDFETDQQVDVFPIPDVQSLVSASWKNGNIIRQTDYKVLVNKEYEPVKEISYLYDEITLKTITGLKVNRNYIPKGDLAESLVKNLSKDFIYFDYPVISGVKKLKYKTQKIFSKNPLSSTETQEFKYFSDKHLLPRLVTSIKSNGDKISLFNTYATDYISGEPFIDNMVRSNIISYPIEEVVFKDRGDSQSIISAKINKFTNDGKGNIDQIFQLEIINPFPGELFKFSNRPLGQLPFNGFKEGFSPDSRYKLSFNALAYDRYSNPLAVKKTDGPVTSYLWGYNGQYPVAEIVNAHYNDVVSAIGGQSVVDALNSGTVTADYIRQKMDILRSNLPGSQVTSYTYKPLVGMTSKTDAKGQTEYYQYDGLQRLQHVLDQFQQLRQSYYYHYRP
ncbi:hypothetical protein [Sphingobacterium spiritivorum]|uniref:hypothetical protein n=1 Tax=Sphingobacterium spiritivorum TaxID=258 RepID=UPI00191A9268|nr:hypothetical protein [Sphingobacterium spiritivorum]QQT26620.1 hypothetical protein I6J02_01810 [Sphingobacterium spiritivorum]